MTDAYVETTVLTDILLKPNSGKQQRAKAAFARYAQTLLPVYSIKEWKAGPMNSFAYLHDKLAVTKSWAATAQAVASLAAPYRRLTCMEAIAAAAYLARKNPGVSKHSRAIDEELADKYRLSIRSLISRSWNKRRRITTRVTDDLSCYTETAPYVGRDGLLNLHPKKCDGDQECCLAPRLKAQPELLEKLRNSIPTGPRKENVRRRQALNRLIKHKNEKLDRETCRDLGDAIFAFFCPPGAVVLTTNMKDHKSLAESIGKMAEKP